MATKPSRTRADRSAPKAITRSLTIKGQVTIPKEVRQVLGVEPREAVVFRIHRGRVYLLPKQTRP